MQSKKEINEYVPIVFWLNLFIILFSSCGNRQALVKIDLIYLDAIKTLSPTVTAQVVHVGDKYFFYTAGEGSILESGEVNLKGNLNVGSTYKIANKFGGLRGLISTQINNTDFLIIGNKAENAIEVHQINEKGRLQQISFFVDTDTTYLKTNITTQLVKIGEQQFVFVGGLDTGLSCLQLTGNGKLNHIQSMADDSTMFLNGIIGMSTLEIDGNTYLFTGGFIDGGISSFRVNKDGSFKNVDNIKDDEQLFLNGTFALNAVQLKRKNFLLVGHRHKVHYPFYEKEKGLIYHGDGINVFKVDGQGKLTLSSLLKDNDQLKLKGSTRIEHIKINEDQAIVFIATRDDEGIQIAALNAKGILKPLKEYDIACTVYNGMTIEKINDQWFLFIGAYNKHKANSYLIKMDR